MPSSLPPGKLGFVFRLTAISAAMGAVYAQIHVAEAGGPLFALNGMPRGALTGAVIGGALFSSQYLPS